MFILFLFLCIFNFGFVFCENQNKIFIEVNGNKIFYNINGILNINKIFICVDSLYLVISDLVVFKNVLFIVEVGVDVFFLFKVGVYVYGILYVKGMYFQVICF